VISKGTGVYVIMLAVFGAGLWAILSFGSIVLRAPTDLAGTWELRPPGTGKDARPAHTLVVEQSGRFFEVAIDGSPARSFKRVGEQVKPTGSDDDETMVAIRGSETELTFRGIRNGDEYDLSGTGVLAGQWKAQRVVRTYRKHPSDRASLHPGS
jgi:hypothetical protein